jgi:hypothetical protein
VHAPADDNPAGPSRRSAVGWNPPAVAVDIGAARPARHRGASFHQSTRSVRRALLWHRRLRQFIGHHYDEAIRLSNEAVRQRGDFVGGHRVLTAAAGMAGKHDVAKAALQELRSAQPNITLAWIAKDLPMRQDADREHDLEGFRRAGLD